MNPSKNDLAAIYPRCRSLLDPNIWQQIISGYDLNNKPDNFPEIIMSYGPHARLPEFLTELARFEWNIFRVKENSLSIPYYPEEMPSIPHSFYLSFSGKTLWKM